MLLQADNVSFAYGDAPVLRGVSFTVGRGSLVGILGPNGSGKTTMLRILAGTLRPDSGSVTLDGRNLAKLPRAQVARQIAVVPQETHLAFDYTTLEIALMGRYPHLGPFQLEGPRDLVVAREALAATGVAELEPRLFNTLSGGEKQRVIIASALAQLRRANGGSDATPAILLLDEPTASLDLAYQLEIASLLERLHRDHGIAIAVSTHDLNFAAMLCSDLIMLRRGEVIASGPTDRTLTPLAVRALYSVEAEVRRHEGSGRLTVFPVRKAE